jgi:hypothetical protein
VFALGYYDRVAHKEQIARFESVTMDPQRPGTFLLQDETASSRRFRSIECARSTKTAS